MTYRYLLVYEYTPALDKDLFTVDCEVSSAAPIQKGDWVLFESSTSEELRDGTGKTWAGRVAEIVHHGGNSVSHPADDGIASTLCLKDLRQISSYNDDDLLGLMT